MLEPAAAQAKEDALKRVYSPVIYFCPILDILTIVLIVKFTQKPLR